jgi:hypothetical protein
MAKHEELEIIEDALAEIRILRHRNEILEAKVSSFEMAFSMTMATPPTTLRSGAAYPDPLIRLQRLLDDKKSEEAQTSR